MSTSTTAKPSGVLSEVAALVQVVKRDADGAILLLGCFIVLAGIVSQVGPWEFESVAPLWVSIPLGLAFIVAGGVWVVRDRRRLKVLMPRTLSGTLPDLAFDPEFLLKAFIHAMPPAFVKEVTDSGSSEHVLQSDALAQMQSLNDAIPLPLDAAYTDERRQMIKADHRRADKRAVETGRSRQIEYLDALEGDPLRTVLTTKTRVLHGGRTFLVGWAIPVYLTGSLPSDTVELRQDSNSVQYRLAFEQAGSGIKSRVGETVLKQPPHSTFQSSDQKDPV